MSKSIYSDDHQYIITHLKKARKDAGLGQIEVAKRLGRTQAYVSLIENGQRRVDVVQLQQFAKIYNKDISYFLKQ